MSEDAPDDATKLETQRVKSLCEQIGYGRVMQLASALWRQKDPLGALTVGPCAAYEGDDATKLEIATAAFRTIVAMATVPPGVGMRQPLAWYARRDIGEIARNALAALGELEPKEGKRP